MEYKDSTFGKDKEYFREISKDYPHLRHFIELEFPARFKNATKQTQCDNPECKKKLRADEVNIFVGPGPAYLPYLYCRSCLKIKYNEVAGSGEYDLHVRHLPKK